MLSPLEALLLGTLQGVTEWLPISSSGHLVILQAALGITLPLLFDASLHLGTLSVILAYFRSDISRILKATAKWEFQSEDGRYVPLLLTGLVPTALIALVFQAFLESLFYNPYAVAIAYLAATPLLYAARTKSNRERLNYTDAFLIGLFQGVGIVPGISRSGVTIGVGLLRGLGPQTATKYSFLLSAPTIIGAVALESTSFSVTDPSLGLYVAAVSIAAAVGYLSLRILLRTLQANRYHLFACYTGALGMLMLVTSSTL